ncbi:MAG: DUF1800 domain-containing protein [Lapillicoccus sp.]
MSTASVGAEWSATARLLRRAGFGATGAEIDAAVAQGASAWLSAALASDPEKDPGALRTPVPSFETLPRPGKAAAPADKKARNQKIAAQNTQLTAWWLRRMVAVESPLGEKLTFGWHNHFATSESKVRVPSSMLAQNTTLRRMGRGSFTALAEAMATDAAMLRWLDGNSSTAKAPNENLSREFMELFALGHGDGYTEYSEQDVREGARALTGWTIGRDGAVQFVASRHDDGVKTVLGQTGPLDMKGFVEAVLGRPGSPAFLVTRWWQLLVAPTPPPPASLQRAVAAYGTGRDLKAMFAAILSDPELAVQSGTLVVTPVEWLVGAVRALRVPVDDDSAQKLTPVFRALGQIPFYPPSVAGWPSGQAWLSTASAQTRFGAATRLAAAGNLDSIEKAEVGSRVEAVRHLLGIPTLSDRTVVALRTAAKDPQRLVATALVSPEYLVN